MPSLPPWIKVRLPGSGDYYDVRKRLGAERLHTVCEEARCPNIAQCWGGGTATFMIMGDVCTRGCRFCDVTSGRPKLPPDPDEPARLARAAADLGLKYVVVTSVDRDDLTDQGASHFVAVVRGLKQALPGAMIELLTPDFQGQVELLAEVAASGAEVLGHNLETVRSLTPSVRDPRCGYELTLDVLRGYRALDPFALVKSSMMLGLGESREEVSEALEDLRTAGVDWVALGQYLRPSRKHLPVARFLRPEEFDDIAAEARRMGFPLVSAGPLVRSSYRAAEAGAERLYAARRARAA